MIYRDKATAIKDMQWLTQECTLSHFAASRLTSYELNKLEEKLTGIEQKSIFDLYSTIFEMFGLKKASWSKTLSHVSLPALALIPNEGVRIIIEQEADGR